MAKVEVFSCGDLTMLGKPRIRNYLFLQGIASPFFSKLAEQLRSQGHQVHKIQLCAGDQIFWKGRSSAYRGNASNWPKFLENYLAERQITDICLFGEARPIHRPAMAIAQQRGLPVHVFEEGYLRPSWITIDLGGANANSSFEFTPEARDQTDSDETLPAWRTEASSPIRGGVFYRIVWDILFHAANIVGAPLFPRYKHHRPDPVIAEGLGWVKRVLTKRLEHLKSERDLNRVVSAEAGYYFVPLQLNADAQIRFYSTFGRVERFVEKAIASFAQNAPEGTNLLIKSHPLHNGLVNWRRVVEKLAKDHGVDDQVGFVDEGNTNKLIRRSRGVVLVNSTTGLTAVQDGVPTIALGSAIYDVPGVTHQGPLDAFWTDPQPPDARMVSSLSRSLIAQTQVKGSYFDPAVLDDVAQRTALCLLDRKVPSAKERQSDGSQCIQVAAE